MIFALVLLTLESIPSLAQRLIDSKGTDFWVAFPPNDRGGGSADSYLSIFITGDKTTNVKLAARRLTGEIDSIKFVVPANTVVSTRLEFELYELVGRNYPSGPNNDNQRASPASVHILADEEVSVYALTREVKTSDAWLVMPVDALGTDYRVISYSSDVRSAGFFPVYFPSQFVVIATEDNTSVSFSLSTKRTATNSNSGDFSTVLNRGESYLVQAYMNSSNRNDDLTGSRVRSDKPVVVLGSHKRAQVPILSNDASRDILVEQLPAVDTWGKNYVVVPLVPPANAVKDGQTDVTICRVLAHQDSSMVSINGAPGWRLNAGIRWDMPLTKPLVITSNYPVLVAIIDRSANRSGSGNASLDGDPSLTIIPPIEQFLDKYRVVSIEPREPGNEFYNAHYLTLTSPLLASGTLKVDGVTQPALTPIPGSTHGYVHVPVKNGSHFVQGDSAFGIVIYGYGPAESYGYTGGMAFEKLFAPSIRLRAFNLSGKPGKRDSLIVVVDSISEQASFDAMGARNVSGEIRFNQTMFVPDSPLTADFAEYVNYKFTHSFDTLRIGDTVATITGTLVLGMNDVDSIVPHSIVWKQIDNSLVSVKSTSIPGLITTLEICDKNGMRLFSPLQAQPNFVQLYSYSGLLLQVVPDSQFENVTEALGNGVYFVKRGLTITKLLVAR